VSFKSNEQNSTTRLNLHLESYFRIWCYYANVTYIDENNKKIEKHIKLKKGNCEIEVPKHTEIYVTVYRCYYSSHYTKESLIYENKFILDYSTYVFIENRK